MRGGLGPALVNHFTLPRFWHCYGQLRPISRNGIRMRFLPIEDRAAFSNHLADIDLSRGKNFQRPP